MESWLYQMSDIRTYEPRDYLQEMWEGWEIDWRHHISVTRKTPRDRNNPAAGDRIVFARCKSVEFPGFYGWGVITRYEPVPEQDDPNFVCLMFRLTPPSDQLKMSPWADKVAIDFLDEIRAGAWQGTMFHLRPAHMLAFQRGIGRWLAGH
jgi:hypothetical protein